MRKYLKYGLYALGGLIGLLLLIVAIVAATFNPNDYKQKVIDLVLEEKGRTLKLEGDIKLAFWPNIGADLGKISLSEHHNTKEFAAVEGVKVSLALLPLLKKELIVDTVYIDGAKANIVRYKDGTNNFDDLLSNDDEESPDIKFDIDGINITNSEVSYLDEATSAIYNITKLNLRSGRIALATPVDLTADFTISSNQEKMTADAQLKGNFLVDSVNQHYIAKGFNATIKGSLLGGKNVDVAISGHVNAKPTAQAFLIDNLKLVGSGQFNGTKLTIDLTAPQLNVQKDEVTSKRTTVSFMHEKAGETVKAHLALADIKGSLKELQSSGITGDISALQGKRTLSSQFSSPFSGNLDSLLFDLPKLVGNIEIKDPNLPNGGMQGSFNLMAHADIKNALANSNFSLTIDDTKLTGNVAVARFKKPSIKFNLNADKLNLNKLLINPYQVSKSSPTEKPSSKTVYLTVLNSSILDGKLSVGRMLYGQYQISGLNVGVKTDSEKLTLSDLEVKIDDSRINGNVAISLFAKPLYTFDLDIDQLDVDRYVATGATDSKTDKPFDLTALKTLNADGSLRIGKLKYGSSKASNIHIELKADGEKGATVKAILNAGNKAEPMTPKNTDGTAPTTSPTKVPKSAEDQITEKAAKKLKNLLKF
ncbi:MAG: AsmA family protein [Methylotenera sp.]|nr:AsmA family protein [Methylotenera sp.]